MIQYHVSYVYFLYETYVFKETIYTVDMPITTCAQIAALRKYLCAEVENMPESNLRILGYHELAPVIGKNILI